MILGPKNPVFAYVCIMSENPGTVALSLSLQQLLYRESFLTKQKIMCSKK